MAEKTMPRRDFMDKVMLLGHEIRLVWVEAVFAALFDDLVYGYPLTNRYPSGEITFSLDSVLPNMRYMPMHLLEAMPMLVFGLLALLWIIIILWLMLRRVGDEASAAARRDLWVGLALGDTAADLDTLYERLLFEEWAQKNAGVQKRIAAEPLSTALL